jgi:hypothetical protein
MSRMKGYTSAVHWGLAGTMKRSTRTTSAPGENKGCTFPGPQNAPFRQSSFFQLFHGSPCLASTRGKEKLAIGGR